MTCIMRVGSTSCVPGSSVGSGRRAGWKPCISACWGCGCSGAATPSPRAPSSVLWAVPLSIAARTSRSTMRPAGPEPSIFERSRSFSSASLRTIGEALKCPSARPSACPSTSSASPSSGASVSLATLFGLLFRFPAPLAALGDLFPFALDKRYRVADGHVLALVRDQLCERPCVLGLELQSDFVGLDLCYGVSLGDLLALALEPLEEGALLHRVAHLGHNDFRHLTSPPRTEPCGPRW